MSSSLPVDPALAMQQATQNSLVQRKMDMDALKKRLGDTATKEEKLRESCEGFEAIFLQKMWEQMRKTVPKEGYLHSKDEEMYQSLFDIELCKKMAGAGGIGLADMLYEQLSMQLENTGRTTSPSSYRNPLDIAPAGLHAESKREAAPSGPPPPPPVAVLSKEHLYSPLPEQEKPEPAEATEIVRNHVADALQELRAELGLAPKEGLGVAVSEWASARAAATGQRAPGMEQGADGASDPAQAGLIVGNTITSVSPTAGQGEDFGRQARPEVNSPAASSLSGTSPLTESSPVAAQESKIEEPAAAKKKTPRLFGKEKRRHKTDETAAVEKSAPTPPRGMAPQNTLWPLNGEGGVVTSHFGWEDDVQRGKRRWNSGVRIEAEAASPVRAVLDGTVVYSGQREGYGHTVVLEHKDGFRSYYSNLEEGSLQVGDRIRHGAEFAKLAAQADPGQNGENSASLYFEFKKGEMAINPENAIKRIEG